MNTTLICSILLMSLSSTLFAKNAELLCHNPELLIVQDKAQKSTYKNCKRNGMTWWYTDKGKVKSKVNFIDGKENGLYSSYYDNGKKKIIVHYVNAQKNGTQKIYYDNGILGSVVEYKNGRREGLMVDYDIEGDKSAEVFYKHNYKVGLKKFYDKKGNVIRTQTYKMDRNPVVVQMLKNKRKEVLIDLAKYGLMPKSASLEERMR